MCFVEQEVSGCSGTMLLLSPLSTDETSSCPTCPCLVVICWKKYEFRNTWSHTWLVCAPMTKPEKHKLGRARNKGMRHSESTPQTDSWRTVTVRAYVMTTGTFSCVLWPLSGIASLCPTHTSPWTASAWPKDGPHLGLMGMSHVTALAGKQMSAIRD